MRFFAFIRPNSSIDKAWRAKHRTGGTVLGIEFNIMAGAVVLAANATGGTYRSRELEAFEVTALSREPGITVEMIGSLPTPEPTPAPVKETQRKTLLSGGGKAK